MISRRNIRVKVMQVLYALEWIDSDNSGAAKANDPVKLLNRSLDRSRELFVFLLYHLTSVAAYAETDAYRRASKNLPSVEDRNVNTKIASNTVLWKIREAEGYQAAMEKDKPELRADKDMIRKLYNKLVESEPYKYYIAELERTPKAEKEIIQFIFSTLMLPNEDFVAYVEENFNNWDDDAEMMQQLMLSYLQKPGSFNLGDMVSEEKWLYAKNLLTTVNEKKAYLMELITPKLKNWDVERIARLDMIILKMGVSELLYFETIPTKVTINEYIDVAKDYSTAQSGHFVNGILDSIHKELLAANKIHKIDFKSKSS